MYQKKVKLIVTSVVSLNEVFVQWENKRSEEILLTFRCLSKMAEMQTRGYLEMPHLSLID